MTLRLATAGDLPVLADLAVAFYEEDGFATPRPALTANLGVLLASPDRARVAVAADDRQVVGFGITTTDVSHLFRYYAANGFTDDGRRLLSRPL